MSVGSESAQPPGTAHGGRIAGSRRWSRRDVLRGGLGAAMVGAGLPALSSPMKPATRVQSGSVTMWWYPLLSVDKDTAFWNGVVSDFHKSHPKIEVKVQMQSFVQRDTKLLLAVQAGQGPDVAYVNGPLLPEYVPAKAVLPLDKHVSVNSYIPAARGAMRYQGHTWIAPLLIDATALLYNQTLFKQVGSPAYPTTWAEIEALGPKFKSIGKYVTSFNAADGLTSFPPLVWEAGGAIFNRKGTRVAFDSPAGVRAVQFLVDLVHKGYAAFETATAADVANTAFGKGEVAVGMPVWENSTILRYSQILGQDVLKVGPILKDKVKISGSTVAGYSIIGGTKNENAALTWIQYASHPSVINKLCRATGFFNPVASSTDIWKGDPVFEPLEHNLPDVRLWESNEYRAQVFNILIPALESAILGQTSAAAALKKAAQASNSLLKEKLSQ